MERLCYVAWRILTDLQKLGKIGFFLILGKDSDFGSILAKICPKSVFLLDNLPILGEINRFGQKWDQSPTLGPLSSGVASQRLPMIYVHSGIHPPPAAFIPPRTPERATLPGDQSHPQHFLTLPDIFQKHGGTV